MKTLKNLIDDINSGKTICPDVSVDRNYKIGTNEIITDDFEVWYSYSTSLFTDSEENPCFRQSKSIIEVEITHVYDECGDLIPYDKFEAELIEVIENNTKVY